MRVFVTGAGGFIGSAVVRALAARNHEVVALLHTAKKRTVAAPGVESAVGDVTRPETFPSAANDADAIVHLALPGTGSSVRRARPVWIEGTRNLLALARARSMRAFVHASGPFGMYRHAPGEWLDESAEEEPSTRFSRGRRDADAIVRATGREHGLRVTILRPSTVYGDGGPFRTYFLEMMRKRLYRVVGDGANYTGFVHLDDCALAFALAAERPPDGETVFVTDDTPVTLREASDVVADALRVRRPRHVPAFLARLVVGRDAVALITESVRLRNANARSLLAWSPRFASIRDGIQTCV